MEWTREILLAKKKPGYSQTDLAQLSGLHVRTIGRVAHRLFGKNSDFSVDEAVAILNAIKPTPGNPNWKKKGEKNENRN